MREREREREREIVCVCVRERAREREREREREEREMGRGHGRGATSYRPERSCHFVPTLETTQGQIDGFVSQHPFKCYLLEVASLAN